MRPIAAPRPGGDGGAPSRHAVLDLGSNSFHVLIADVAGDGTIVPVGREREMLHLGAAVQEHGHVPERERRAAIATVAHLSELAGRLGARGRWAVATSALRDATNGPEIIAEMSALTGSPVDVIDGDEEARLSYQGVRASIATAADPLLVVDLGGGSLEFAVGSGADVIATRSVDLGVSRLSTMVTSDPMTEDDRRRLKDHVRGTVAEVVRDLSGLGIEQTVAVGGTIRALARVMAAERDHWLPVTLNQFAMPTDHVRDLNKRLAKLDRDGRADLPGMKSRRADRIHIASRVVWEVLRALDVDQAVLSDWGLREGVLLDRLGITPTMSGPALQRREANRLRRTFVPDDPHLEHVADLTVQLFDGTRDLHGMGDEDRDVLWCAATLHDVGETLALRRHARHGAYLVEHAELRGFTPRQTAMMCSVVRFHASRGCSTDYEPFHALSRDDRRRTEQYVALLQLADGLDRARDQSVRTIDVALADDHVTVRLHGTDLHVAKEEFDRKTRVFERVFNRSVEVTTV